MKRAYGTHGGGGKCIPNSSWWKTEEMKQHASHRLRQEDTIKMNLIKIEYECVNCTHLTLGCDQ
jgi:hypothetical protein